MTYTKANEMVQRLRAQGVKAVIVPGIILPAGYCNPGVITGPITSFTVQVVK